MQGKVGGKALTSSAPDGKGAAAAPAIGKRSLVEVEAAAEDHHAVPARGEPASIDVGGAIPSGGSVVQRFEQKSSTGEPPIQRKEDPAAAMPGTDGAAGPGGAAGGPPATGMLVDDHVAGGPQQMRRADFLAKVEPAIKAAVSAELGPWWNVAGCPHIEKYLAAYRGQPAAVAEQFVRR
jgi:hypothetical protein